MSRASSVVMLPPGFRPKETAGINGLTSVPASTTKRGISANASTARVIIAGVGLPSGVAGTPGMAHSFHAQDAPEPILDLHQHTPYNYRPRDLVLAHQDQHHVKSTVILPGEGWMLKII